jgi:hypothetical protein
MIEYYWNISTRLEGDLNGEVSKDSIGRRNTIGVERKDAPAE